jgi:enoyl-[acyl-carrier-protein] reductase (NADH)
MIQRGVVGSIVNISSMSSFQALPYHAAYAASKAGLDQLSKVMAVELGPHNIRVNAINPTVVMTEMGKRAWSDPSKGGPMLARIPLRRFAECDDIASVACFVLSDAAGMLNGLALRVDGGFWRRSVPASKRPGCELPEDPIARPEFAPVLGKWQTGHRLRSPRLVDRRTPVTEEWALRKVNPKQA